MKLWNFSKYHIDMDVKEEDGREWRFTGVYGEPQMDLKFRTWQTLRSLTSAPVKAWLLAGDFNEILFAHEKEGGRQRSQWCMDDFREALQACRVEDLGFEGDRFTWRNNNHRVEGYIRERLDRAVANIEWQEMFPNVKIINGDPRHSDHRPLVIDTGPEEVRRRGGTTTYRFEAAWTEEEECKEVVKKAWREAKEGGRSTVYDVLESVSGDLARWGSNVLGGLEKQVKELKRELEWCRRQGVSQENISREGVLRYKLDKTKEQVDLFWKQRAHVKWMQFGDRNTAFFHACCSERRRTNKIGRLKKENGEWVEEEEEKRVFITNHFPQLFRASNNQNTQRLLDCVDVKVTPEMNALLLMEFTREEVWEALKSIGNLKAPGPDGNPALFYKEC